MKFYVVSFALFAAICYQCVSIELTNEHMHPSPTPLKEEGNSRMKRAEQRFHVDGYESTSQYWKIEAQKRLIRQLDRNINEKIAKNAIMFLGDGMSISTITAARIYQGQKQGYSGEENVLSFEDFPYLGLSKVGSIKYLLAVI